MNRRTIIGFLTIFSLLLAACQQTTSSIVTATSTDPAVNTVKSALDAIHTDNLNSFNQQLSLGQQQTASLCPGGTTLGCAQTMFLAFANDQHAPVKSPNSVIVSLFPKQTTPTVKIVLAESNWGGTPPVIGCQVFYVMQYSSNWLIETIDNPGANTCEQRAAELQKNLFGS